ncbi:heparan sulfate 2-O-sulfotransferase 1-like [Tigriopus californicus]|uniref:heparan sulfate 2-O-sulfotransferase 1-like n=1 Tax=Tigriopus californicus TaxID=6832 RepID=UPI0027DA2260|nr:heparan sulfate 2-O-sulfotransferase 1-like [Tigriopus californicus]
MPRNKHDCQYLTLFSLTCLVCWLHFIFWNQSSSPLGQRLRNQLKEIRQNRTNVGGVTTIHRHCQHMKDTFSPEWTTRSIDETTKMLFYQRIALDRDDPNQTFWTLGEILEIQRSVSNDGKPLTKLRPKEYPSLRPDAMTQMCFSPTNRSIPRQRLIYNRVPKCASSTMQSVITFLGLRNNFDYRASNIFWKRLQSTSEERHWIRAVNQEIQGLQRPLVTDRHFYFVDLEQYGSERVNWINIVRDPIERLISEFYYLRHPKRWMNQSRRPSQTWFNLTFNECLQNGLPECMFHLDGNYLRELQLTYFCGSALECSQVGNLRALQQAKSNLERHYSVVGIMSDLETSLRVMEAYLPAFFTGAEHLFRRMRSPNGEEFRRNPGIKPVTPLDSRLHESLKSNLSTEYQFYEFALKRLIDQDRHIRKSENE